MTAKSLNSLLQQSSGQDLASLADKARRMVDLSDAVSQALPPELSGEIQGTNIRESGELVVLAASSPAAARLRFEGEKLLEAARNLGFTVQSVTIRVGRQESVR